jgi:WSC domain
VINTSSVKQTSTDPSVNGCSMPCQGNSLELCGGSNRLNIYMLNLASTSASAPSSMITNIVSSSSSTGILTLPNTSLSTNSQISISSSSQSTLSLSSTSSVAPVPTGPITVTSLSGHAYMGCYSEGTNGRALSDLQNPILADSVSVEACAAACSKYTYFGVEYSHECK